MESFRELLENEAPLLHDGAVRVYILDWVLRVTYHNDALTQTYAQGADFYAERQEVMDTDDLSEFLCLDARERDLVAPLALHGYYLIGERREEYTWYIADFLKNHQKYIVDGEEREIPRSIGKHKLVLVKLHLNNPNNAYNVPQLKDTFEQYQVMVHEILNSLSSK